MEIKSTSFRVGALVLGAAGIIVTAFLSSISIIAITCGAVFGAGGWLIDYFTGFRKLGGHLSSWSLAAGGAVVVLSTHRGLEGGALGFERSTTYLQYASVVLICWGTLMCLMPKKQYH